MYFTKLRDNDINCFGSGQYYIRFDGLYGSMDCCLYQFRNFAMLECCNVLDYGIMINLHTNKQYKWEFSMLHCKSLDK